jgi:hypothetical protein
MNDNDNTHDVSSIQLEKRSIKKWNEAMRNQATVVRFTLKSDKKSLNLNKTSTSIKFYLK